MMQDNKDTAEESLHEAITSWIIAHDNESPKWSFYFLVCHQKKDNTNNKKIRIIIFFFLGYPLRKKILQKNDKTNLIFFFLGLLFFALF